MFKKSLLLGISSGILAGIAGIILLNIYKEAFFTDFSIATAMVGSVKIKITATSIMLITLFMGVLASVIQTLFIKWFKAKGDAIFSLLFAFLSFALMIVPISATFDPNDKNVDDMIMLMFPGFGMTLLFFPALVWFSLKPLFFGTKTN